MRAITATVVNTTVINDEMNRVYVANSETDGQLVRLD